jgi:DNA-directed RNA polymerase specialized sigma24 family protein
MPDDQPYLLRPGISEQVVAKEMMSDQHPEHWEACSSFVNHCVNAKARNIPIDHHEDIGQEVMYKVKRGLPSFRFESTLKGWVNIIIERCIIDAHRRLQNEESTHVLLIDQTNESDREGEGFTTSEVKSAEDAFMTNDEIRSGWAACVEYASTHANPDRNLLIIWMVIHKGKTYAEAARAAGCSEPVVGYVVREAQLYARRMRDRQ